MAAAEDLVLGGEIEELTLGELQLESTYDDVPWITCPRAFVMTLGTVYSGITYPTATQWFKCSLAAATTYRLTFTIASNLTHTVAVTTGASCPGTPNGPVLSYFAQTRTLTTVGATTLWLQLIHGVSSAKQEYTLEVKTPP
jgi:hypothetical protein